MKSKTAMVAFVATLLAGLHAQALESSLSLTEALEAAALHPEVRALREAGRRRGEIERELGAISGNPTLHVQPGYRSDPSAERRGFEGQLGLQQPIDLTGLAGARVETARWETAALAAQADAATLSRLLAAARAWVDRRAADEWLVAARGERAAAASLLLRVETAAKAEVLTAVDLDEARAHAAEAQLLELEADGAAFERGLELARAAGTGDAPLATRGETPAPPLPPADRWPALVARAKALPSVLERAIAVQAARARELEIGAERGPRLSLGLLGQKDALGSWVLSGTAQLTPSMFDTGARDRATAAARSEELAGEQATRQLDATAALALAAHEVEHARETLEELERSLLPAVERLVASREALLAAGETTVIDLLRARGALATARGRVARARGMRTWAEVQLWLLAQAVDGPVPIALGGRP